MISEQNIFECALKATSEQIDCSYPVSIVSNDESQQLIRSSANVDLDFLLLFEKCSLLFSHEVMFDIFADLSCSLFSSSFKEHVYSKTMKDLLSFGTIGDYKVSFVLSRKGVAEEVADDDQIDNETADVAGIEADEMITVGDINYFLTEQYLTFKKFYSYSELVELLVQKFPSATICIFRYGQKVDYQSMKVRIINLISVAKIPVELALAKQYKLADSFLGIRYASALKNYAYSNFLSNEMCNILVNSHQIAQTFCPNCYRLAVYNTFQHSKKNIDLVLRKQSGTSSSILGYFANSVVHNVSLLGQLGEQVKNTELRVEIYFGATTVEHIRSATKALAILLNSFQLVQRSSLEVFRHFNSTRLFLSSLYAYCSSLPDSSSFLFIFYYHTFMAYLYSTCKVCPKFIESNFGLYLKNSHIDRETKKLTIEFYNEHTIQHVWGKLSDVFGTTKKSKLICANYLFLYFIEFRRQIESNPCDLKFAVEKIGSCIFENNSYNDPDNEYNTCTDSIQTILKAFSQKVGRNKLLSGILSQILSLSYATSEFVRKLEEYLRSCNFKVNYNDTVYLIGGRNNVITELSFDNCVDFGMKYSYSEFMQLYRKPKSTRTRPENIDVLYAQQLFEHFVQQIQNIGPWFHEITFMNDDLSYDAHVEDFLSFIFMSLPSDLKLRTGTVMRKFVNIFSGFSQMFRFIYVALFRYYKSDHKVSQRMSKFCERSLAFGKNTSKPEDSSYTFNRVVYFSGLFDRRGQINCIVPPFDGKLSLISRYGKSPIRQITQVCQLYSPSFQSEEMTPVSKRAKTPIEELFENSEHVNQLENFLTANSHFNTRRTVGNMQNEDSTSFDDSDSNDLSILPMFGGDVLQGSAFDTDRISSPVQSASKFHVMANDQGATIESYDATHSNSSLRIFQTEATLQLSDFEVKQNTFTSNQSADNTVQLNAKHSTGSMTDKSLSIDDRIQTELPSKANNSSVSSNAPVLSAVESNQQTGNDNEQSVNSMDFRGRLEQLFHTAEQQYIAKRLVENSITIEDIQHSSQVELKGFLMTFFQLKALEASSVSTILKKEFQ